MLASVAAGRTSMDPLGAGALLAGVLFACVGARRPPRPRDRLRGSRDRDRSRDRDSRRDRLRLPPLQGLVLSADDNTHAPSDARAAPARDRRRSRRRARAAGLPHRGLAGPRLGARRRPLGRRASCSASCSTGSGIGEPNLRGSGVVAFGMMARGILLMIVALAVAVTEPDARDRGRARLRGRLLARARSQPHDLLLGRAEAMNALLGAMNLVLAAVGGLRAAGRVRAPGLGLDPHRAARHVRSTRRSSTSSSARRVTIILGIWIMRFGLSLRPSRRQTIGEALYELVHGQIAESSLPTKATLALVPVRRRALPLHLDPQHRSASSRYRSPTSTSTSPGSSCRPGGSTRRPRTSRVTLALALITFVATHFEGIRFNGPVRYFKSWVPAGRAQGRSSSSSSRSRSSRSSCA